MGLPIEECFLQSVSKSIYLFQSRKYSSLRLPTVLRGKKYLSAKYGPENTELLVIQRVFSYFLSIGEAYTEPSTSIILCFLWNWNIAISHSFLSLLFADVLVE